MSKEKTERGGMALALQGGGSHGAFTWGVLHALLDDERVDWPKLKAISGTSAGALNAAVLSAGYAKGDADDARLNAQKALAAFWQDVSATGYASPFTQSSNGNGHGKSSAHAFAPLLDWWSDAAKSYMQQFSPYQLNPMNVNPLRVLLEKHASHKALTKFRSTKLWRLHVAATEVSSGTAKVFTGDDVNTDTLMASACLPMIFQAVEIECKHYWDGGYSANPPLAPLLHDERVDSILLVALSATSREGLPQSAADITERERDFGFASPLGAELRLWNAMQKRLEKEGLQVQQQLPSIEVLRSKNVINQLGTESKLSTDASLLQTLFDAGKDAASCWLKQPPAV